MAKFKNFEKWDVPLNGTYKEKVTNYDGTFQTFDIKVRVLGESEKSYWIHLLENTTKYKPYHEMAVRKKSVVIPDLNKTIDKTVNYWWKDDKF